MSITFDGMYVQTQSGGGQAFSRIMGPALGITGEIGQPELPVWRGLVEVPRGAADVRLEGVRCKTECIATRAVGMDYPVYPVQPPREKTRGSDQNKPFVWDRSSYQKGVALPEDAMALEPFGTVRGRRLFLATVRLAGYDPGSSQVHIRRWVSFDVRWQNQGLSQKEVSTSLDSPYFDPLFDQLVVAAPDPLVRAETKDLPSLPIGFLIIAAPALAGDANLAELAQWKTERGFHTTLVSTDTTGTSAESIRTYIQNAYATWAVPPVFVLLVGDTDIIPSWTGGGTGTPQTDLNYSTVDGTEWNTPDLYIGRFPVRTATDLANAVTKTLHYELGTWPSGYSGWEKRAAFMAGTDNNTITEGTHNWCITTHLDPAGYASDRVYVVTHSATTSTITAALDAGRSLAVFSGHGSEYSWADGPSFSQSNVRSLTNGVSPFVMGFACVTGSYHLSECFGETWVRDEYAGLAYCGSSVNSYWDEDDILERRVLDGAFVNAQTWLAGMWLYGKQRLYAHYGSTGTVQRYFEMYNLLGDPSVDLYTGTPGALSVSHPPVLPAGASSFQVNVGQAGALVAVSQGGTLCGTALSSGGLATVSLSPRLYSGTATVTASLHNFLPYQAIIPVGAGSDGLIQMDQSAYACSSVVTVSVADEDLEGSPSQAITITTTGGDAETVTCLVTGVPSIFIGNILTACGTRVQGNGTIDVTHGEVITASYNDQDNGTGSPEVKSDTALADLQGPVISDVQVTGIGSATAQIGFSTDEPARSRILYGTSSSGPFPNVMQRDSYETAHVFSLTALSPATAYFYRIDAWDATANRDADTTTRSFATEEQADYFTELFSGANDLGFLSVTFTPDSSGDFYRANAASASAFPTNPSGGTVLPLADDDNETVTLGGGARVSLYGVTYGTFYVGSNGYLTFGTPDSDYSESLTDHFGIPRISALFDDLNPSATGTVSWKQLSDRVAVTYQNVPEYNVSAANSFQIEMFFDGTIRITWLGIAATDGLAGLSQGSGLPADFIMSDLSSYPEPVVDSDGDGLADDEERILGTDPYDRDSDDDGIEDWAEVHTHGTNPLAWDSDGDGFSDGMEVAASTDPNKPTSFLPLSEVWVDFAYAGVELGTSLQPVSALARAVPVVAAGGVIQIKGNTAVSKTPECLRITKRARIRAVNGTVSLGKAAW